MNAEYLEVSSDNINYMRDEHVGQYCNIVSNEVLYIQM
jgi:hypothetical protein